MSDPIWMDVGEVKRWPFELVDQVVAGGEFVITRGGQPVAVLTAYLPEAPPPEEPR